MKRILCACLLFLIACSIAIGSMPQTQPPLGFEVATVKPHGPEIPHMIGGSCHGTDSSYPPGLGPPLGRCVFTASSLTYLIGFAYPSTVGAEIPQKVTGGQSWIDTEYWEVEGKAEDAATVTKAQLTQMLQRLLADRFKLQFHREVREVDGYRLVVAKGGPKIAEDLSGDDVQPGMSAGQGVLTIRKYPLAHFVWSLNAGAPVVDRTGLTGVYSFTFKQPRGGQPSVNDADAETAPTIFTALQEQLGLKLEPQKIPQDVIVIDRAERPVSP